MTIASENVAGHTPGRLLSVGHSNHTLDQFLTLLRTAGITAIADVRSSPFSRRYPRFNGPQLAVALRQQGIAYVFLGDQLGGRPSVPALYDADGRADYERVRATDNFRTGLERLIQETERHVIAMMCGEEDPLDCHRGVMIAVALTARGVAPLHLRRDGTLETNAAMEVRLLQTVGIDPGELDGLFADQATDEDRRERLALACRRRAERIAYRRSADSSTLDENAAEQW